MYIWDCKIAAARTAVSPIALAATLGRAIERLRRSEANGSKAAPPAPAPEDASTTRSDGPGLEKPKILPATEA